MRLGKCLQADAPLGGRDTVKEGGGNDYVDGGPDDNQLEGAREYLLEVYSPKCVVVAFSDQENRPADGRPLSCPHEVYDGTQATRKESRLSRTGRT